MQLNEEELYNFEKSFAEETIQVLQELVKIDTTTPPGNEIKAAEWINKFLSKEGIDSDVIESAPGRGNVISRLKGTDGSAPSLLLLSHLDVVPSQDLERWEIPPFSGELKDGYIWGRGTLDCKGTTAPQLMVFIDFHRKGIKPKGDIVFAATADEETGGHYGPDWLLENKFDLIKADNVVTEGGGPKLPMKAPHYTIQVAEKGIYWTGVRMHGAAGHGTTDADGARCLVERRLCHVRPSVIRYSQRPK